jgi:hypothetical protein
MVGTLSDKSKIKAGGDILAFLCILLLARILDLFACFELREVAFAVEALPRIFDQRHEHPFAFAAAPVHASPVCQI